MIRFRSKRLTAGLAVLTAGIIFAGGSICTFAASGTVTSPNVRVRAEASSSSTQISSLDSGDKVDIVDQTTDSQGYVWYRISVNGNEYGYVRSDLVEASGTVSSSDSDTQSESLPETSVTAVESQTATATTNATVRSGAGTNYDSIGSLANGDTVTVTGEATGTDSKKWYQVSFGSSGRTGFVRSDLVQIGQAADTGEATAEDPEAATEDPENPEAPADGEVQEGAEGEVVDENANTEIPVDTTVGNGEFSLAYKADETGTEVWYLYDNVEGTQVKLNDLLTYAAAGQQADQLKAQTDKLKVVMIIMAVIIAVLVLAVLLLVYKLRDFTYYEEEEPEESKSRKKSQYDDLPPQRNTRKSVDSDQIDQPRSKGRVVADSKRTERPERTVTPTRERKAAPMGTAESLLGADRSDRMDRKPAERRPVQPSQTRTEAPESSRTQAASRPQTSGRKPRNFLLEDDDFEFEFLDLDDDDK